jgi:hypothetical protein
VPSQSGFFFGGRAFTLALERKFMPERKSEFNFKPTNPLEAIQDPLVLWTGAGVLAGQFGRGAIYAGARGTFGYAKSLNDGVAGQKRIVYVDDAGKEMPTARTARILANVGMVVAGTLLLTTQQTKEESDIDIFGLGLAASGAANVVQELFQIYG